MDGKEQGPCSQSTLGLKVPPDLTIWEKLKKKRSSREDSYLTKTNSQTNKKKSAVIMFWNAELAYRLNDEGIIMELVRDVLISLNYQNNPLSATIELNAMLGCKVKLAPVYTVYSTHYI